MTWAKIDDQMQSHPKIVAAGPIGELIQYRAIQYCCRHLTDGFLPARSVSSLLDGLDGVGLYAPRQARKGKLASVGYDADEIDWPSEMVKHGLWHRRKEGYEVHDFLVYNRARADVLADRQVRKEAGSKGAKVTNAKRWGSANPSVFADPSADSVPSPPALSRPRTLTPTPSPTAADASHGSNEDRTRQVAAYLDRSGTLHPDDQAKLQRASLTWPPSEQPPTLAQIWYRDGRWQRTEA